MNLAIKHAAWIIEWDNIAGLAKHNPMILSARKSGDFIKSVLETLWINSSSLYYHEKLRYTKYLNDKNVPIHSAGPRYETLSKPYITAYRVHDLQIVPDYDASEDILTWTEPAHRIFDNITNRFAITGEPIRRTLNVKWPTDLKVINMQEEAQHVPPVHPRSGEH